MNQSAMVGDREYAQQNMIDRPLWQRVILLYAWLVAQIMHLGQIRRTGDRYVEHSQAVANLSRVMGLSTSAQAAALLHDVIEENCGIRRVLAIVLVLLAGPVIAMMVFALTKWHGTDEEYLDQILFWSKFLWELPAIKLADKYTCIATPLVRSKEKEVAFLETLRPDGSFAYFISLGRGYVRTHILSQYNHRFEVIQSIAERRLRELKTS